MSGSTFKRKEIKYLLTKDQKDAFLDQIRSYIVADAYEKYSISNVYMDTSDNILIRSSIDKPVYKEKIRIRSYGRVKDSDKIFIELKKKFEGIVYKRRIKMPYGEARQYIAGHACRTGQIESEIDYFLEYYQKLEPAMFIAYDRHAFSGKDDKDLRITFDDNVVWRDTDINLRSQAYGHQLLEANQCILEIKCANAMPLWLARALSENLIYKISFSKYGQAYRQLEL